MNYPINNEAIYHTWLLVVLWFFQLNAELVSVVWTATTVADFPTEYLHEGHLGWFFTLSIIALVGANIFFLSHVVQIVCYARRRLTPRQNFAYDCSRFSVWSFVLILTSILVGVDDEDNHWPLWVQVCCLWFHYSLSLIYATQLYNRERQGAYDNLPPGTVKAGSAGFQIENGNPNKTEIQNPELHQQSPIVVPTPPTPQH